MPVSPYSTEKGETMKMRRLVLALGLAVTLAAAPTPARAQDVHEVMVLNFQFFPSDITVRTGDTVLFIWVEGAHTVSSNDGFFESGLQFTGFMFPVQFPIAGEFRYFCRPHQLLDMVARVRVEKGGVPQTLWWRR